MDSHAQLEIREYATTIGRQIVQPLFPVVWEAFEDYRLGAWSLTQLEIGVIQRLTLLAGQQQVFPPFSEALFLEAQDASWKELTRSRERDECREKLAKLGLVTP
jgi:thymidylate synthase (FAD)